MKSVALCLIAAAAIMAVVVFAAVPSIDLTVADYFHSPEAKTALYELAPYTTALREHNMALTVFVVLFATTSLAIKIIWPRGPMLMPARAALLVVITFALGPALLVNGLLKPHWQRPRPAAVVELGGTEAFTPWWNPRGTCDGNCSFVSGEASSAYALLALAAVLPAPLPVVAVGTVLVYGSLVGLARMAAEGHFLSDVVFAGILMALVTWLCHGFLYRWPSTRLSEAEAERLIVGIGSAIRTRYAAWTKPD